ncbi:hypothetical protein P175DRAFT_0533560 [Aspergillus ochraceoroseus IBT 24754]|uniref:Uncharacterized protein n=1 Tax=Aspergillus ochraceoroseus IBT 24754 TaxID=1392256 RepID=A0A2T5LS75_9EURO|nr:uncharacterized protein P175DRAFT_0533560 [Aspergillus ochraceoroseus IBT 24754]PTU19140.1 hypothetical protein P175DRAFT_0533560 [Aspergillus ochraceoroseus IBT 24754]
MATNDDANSSLTPDPGTLSTGNLVSSRIQSPTPAEQNSGKRRNGQKTGDQKQKRIRKVEGCGCRQPQPYNGSQSTLELLTLITREPLAEDVITVNNLGLLEKALGEQFSKLVFYSLGPSRVSWDIFCEFLQKNSQKMVDVYDYSITKESKRTERRAVLYKQLLNTGYSRGILEQL